MLLTLLMTGVVLTGEDPDGIIATARPTTSALVASDAPVAPEVGASAAIQAVAPQELTTDQQIERWLSARSDVEDTGEAGGATWNEDRRTHGFVDAGVGTGGYRSYGAGVSLPLGENGRLDLTYRQVENGYPYGRYGYGHGYGLDNPLFDDSGYAFPGRFDETAPRRFESRSMRPEGPPRRGAPAAIDGVRD